jgi:hypothetical protein
MIDGSGKGASSITLASEYALPIIFVRGCHFTSVPHESALRIRRGFEKIWNGLPYENREIPYLKVERKWAVKGIDISNLKLQKHCSLRTILI